ncbi:MAG: CPBP family intramembrane metalloprotease [Clostridia bacterium]|nr:CPBP family intramembrane metalloprotease [Clostridia bacterium]
MDWLFKSNSAIDETAATTKRRKFFAIGLTFLIVFYISSIISVLISTVPTYAILFGDEAFMNIISENIDSDYDTIMGIVEEQLPIIIEENSSAIQMINLFTTVGTIICVLFYCIKIEKRRLFTLGFVKKGALVEYAIGLLIGLLMFASVYGIVLLSGEAKFIGFNFDVSIGTVLLFLLGFIIQGASEEILLRGYFFVTCAANTNVIVSILSSSVLFAALHLGNPNFSLLAFVNLFLFGVFAALYFLRRGSIWGICALHTIWNFAQGNIFGCNVSGMPMEDTLLLTENVRGAVWSGSGFGPEGGIAVTMILFIGIVTLTFMKNKEYDGFYSVEKGEFVSDYY